MQETDGKEDMMMTTVMIINILSFGTVLTVNGTITYLLYKSLKKHREEVFQIRKEIENDVVFTMPSELTRQGDAK